MKIALVADWLPTMGGAERVIAEFHALWPDAPIYTTIANRAALGQLRDAEIRTTPLQKWYRLHKHYQPMLASMPRAMEGIDLRDYDVILSSSHAVGKGIVPPSTALHICYCHTPMRYAWEMEEKYLEDFHVPQFLRNFVRRRLKNIRRWDLTSAQRVDVFIANSTTTQERIKRTYARDSTVIHPPVNDRFFEGPMNPNGEYFLAVGRLVPYKRYDLLVEAANALKLPLMIAGRGKEEERLRKMAGPTVKMLGYVPEEDLPNLYADAKAFLFAAHEDAGVVPLEAQACGTPVIAYGMGGVLDTVEDGTTGIFFDEQRVSSLDAALKKFHQIEFDPAVIREHARKFSSSKFKERISRVVEGSKVGSL